MGASAAGVAATTTAMEARQRVLAAGIVAGRADMPLAIAGLIALEVVELLRSTSRQRPVVPMVRVIPVVHMPMDPVRPVEPRPRSQEHTTHKPIRPVVPVWRAIIRRIVEVPIRAIRRASDVHHNL